MESKSSLKYYILGAIVLVVVVVIIVLSLGKSKPAGPNTQTANTVNPTASSAPTPPVVSSTPASPNNDLIGTWTSTIAGQGMQGSGKITTSTSTTKIDFTGDVNLAVQQVENNTGTGTITFNNFCFTMTESVSGKPDVTRPKQCVGGYSQPATMQLAGNTLTYTGKSVLGADISLSGTYTNGSMSGTFTRTSSTGKIDGTFNLTRTSN